MKTQQILAHAPKVLSDEQRRFYFENGYLHIDAFVPQPWLERLWEVTDRFIEMSRTAGADDPRFDVEPDHTAQNPRLRRLIQPVMQDPVYWEFASRGPIVDIAEDLLGPDVKFHHSKLNFKWSRGGEEVRWHQDIQFWPHTNYSVLTIGVYLHEVDDEMGPMGVIPRSHDGVLYDQFADNGRWMGCLKDRDVPRAKPEKAVYLKGPAGSITVHHCRMVHGSQPNRHPSRPRPLLLQAYSSADALPVSPYNTPCEQSGAVVRGQAARWIHFDPRPCQVAPPRPAGSKSIFTDQKAAAAAAE